jgi:hypothetical protein
MRLVWADSAAGGGVLRERGALDGRRNRGAPVEGARAVGVPPLLSQRSLSAQAIATRACGCAFGCDVELRWVCAMPRRVQYRSQQGRLVAKVLSTADNRHIRPTLRLSPVDANQQRKRWRAFSDRV